MNIIKNTKHSIFYAFLIGMTPQIIMLSLNLFSDDFKYLPLIGGGLVSLFIFWCFNNLKEKLPLVGMGITE